MPEIASCVKFDINLLPIGHTRGVYDFEAHPRALEPLAFNGGVGNLEDRSHPYGDLFQPADGRLYATLGDMAALWNAYLSAKRGLFKPTDGQRALLAQYFDRTDRGNVCMTIIDYDHGDPSMKKRHDSDRRVLLINSPERVVFEGRRITEVIGGDAKPKLWPDLGFAGRTCDGSYDEDGVPLETWTTREQAERTWTTIGDDPVFAKKAVSYVWSRIRRQGKAIVIRTFLDHDMGHFHLDADGETVGHVYIDDGKVIHGVDPIGRVPVSR